MRVAALAMVMLSVACAQNDPCAGVAGSCLALEVRWRTRGPTVEQLEIEGTRGLTLPPQSRTPPMAMQPFSLPAVVPLRAPNFGGAFTLVVRAIVNGTVVGDGTVEGTLRAGEHRRFGVQLDAGPDADGGVDLAVNDGDVDLLPDDAALDLKLPCVTPDPAELWVDDDDPSGDGGRGSPGCPLPTLTAALELARTASTAQKTIHLLPGSYTRESFPLVVRDGISIEGSDAANTIVQGSGTWANDRRHAFNYSSGGPTTHLVTLVVGSAGNAVNRISGLTVRPPTIVTAPSLAHTGIVCDRGNAPATLGTAPPPPNVSLDDVTLGPHYFYAVAATNDLLLAEGCNLRVTNSRFTGGIGGVIAIGCNAGTGTGRPPVAVEIGAPAGGGNQFDNIGLSLNDALNLCAVDAEDCVSPVAVHHNRVRTSSCGVQVEANSPSATVEIDDNDLANLRYHGIALTEHTHATLRRNLITNVDGNTLGLLCSDNPALCMNVATEVKARDNRFIGNKTGVAIHGSGLGGERMVLDFGTASDPGGNVFSCNSRTPGNPSYDVHANFSSGTSAGDIFLVGNSWDHATPSSVAFDGADLVVEGPTPPGVIASPAASPQPMGSCPAGRVP